MASRLFKRLDNAVRGVYKLDSVPYRMSHVVEAATGFVKAIASPIAELVGYNSRCDELESCQRSFEMEQMKFNELSGRQYQDLRSDFLASKHEQDRFNSAISERFSGFEKDYGSFRRDQEAFNQSTLRLYNEFQQQYKQDWCKQLDFNREATDKLRSLDERTCGLEEAQKGLRDELKYVTNRSERYFEMTRAFNEQTERHLRTLDGRNEELWRKLQEQKNLFTMVGLAVVLIAGYLYKKHG